MAENRYTIFASMVFLISEGEETLTSASPADLMRRSKSRPNRAQNETVERVYAAAASPIWTSATAPSAFWRYATNSSRLRA
jgi:hypothetical protein